MCLPDWYDDGEIKIYAEVNMNKPKVNVYAEGNMDPIYIDANMRHVPSHFKYARVDLNVHVEVKSKGIIALKLCYLIYDRDELQWNYILQLKPWLYRYF